MRRPLTPLSALALLVLLGACSDECRLDRECASGQLCTAEGRCRNLPPVETPHQDLTDGYDDAPGEGRVFVVDTFAFAPEGVGFDLDGQCRAEGECVDHSLGRFGPLMNDQFRQGLLGGESLLLVEVAGVDEPFQGDDANVTLKVYAAIDADRPFFPADNFQIPQGETDCCEFLIQPSSLDHTGVQAKFRMRAHIEDGQLRAAGSSSFGMPNLNVFSSTGAHTLLELRWAQAAVRLTNRFSRLEDGLIGGVIPASSLFGLANPFCETTNLLCANGSSGGSWLEVMILNAVPLDMDLDGDGLERIETSRGAVAECLDGCDGCISPPRIPPIAPDYPGTCALSSRMADGFSVAVTFSAVPAKIVGVGVAPVEEPK